MGSGKGQSKRVSSSTAPAPTSLPSSLVVENDIVTELRKIEFISKAKEISDSGASNEDLDIYLWDNRKAITQLSTGQLKDLFTNLRPIDYGDAGDGGATFYNGAVNNLIEKMSAEYPNMPLWKEGDEFYQRLRSTDGVLGTVKGVTLRHWGGYNVPNHVNKGTSPKDHGDHPSNTNYMWTSKTSPSITTTPTTKATKNDLPSSTPPEHEFTRKENNDLILESRKLMNSDASNEEVNDFIWNKRKQIAQMPEDQLLDLFNDFRPYDLNKRDAGTADNLVSNLSFKYPNMTEWKEGQEFYERLRTSDNGYQLIGIRATVLRNWGEFRHPISENYKTKPEDHPDHPSNTDDMWTSK